MTELFAPNLEEIETMIKEIEKQMEEAESLAEWRELQHQLNELLEKQKELLLQEKRDMKKQNEDFAIIHNTPKGQLLITREPDGDDEIITLWINLEGKLEWQKYK